MRRRAALLAGALALVATVSAEEGTTGPRIRVEPESFDFGKVLQRSTLSKAFRLRNLGDRDLVIERIAKSCDCSEATVDSSALAPGAATSLRVTVQTLDSSGKVEHQVLVRTNDPETPSFEVRLWATVVAKER